MQQYTPPVKAPRAQMSTTASSGGMMGGGVGMMGGRPSAGGMGVMGGAGRVMGGGMGMGGSQSHSMIGGASAGTGTVLNQHEVVQCQIGRKVTFAVDAKGSSQAWWTEAAPSTHAIPQLNVVKFRRSGGAKSSTQFTGEGDQGSLFVVDHDGALIHRHAADSGRCTTNNSFQAAAREIGTSTKVAAFASVGLMNDSAAAGMVTDDGSVLVTTDVAAYGSDGITVIKAADLIDFVQSTLQPVEEIDREDDDDGDDQQDNHQATSSSKKSGGGGWFGWLTGGGSSSGSAAKKKSEKKKLRKANLDESTVSSLNGSALSSVHDGDVAAPYLQFNDQGNLLFYAADAHLFVISLSAEDNSVQLTHYVDLTSLGEGTQVLGVTENTVNLDDGCCYCLIGETRSDGNGLPGLQTDTSVNTTAVGAGGSPGARNTTLTVVRFSVGTGHLMGQPVNLSFRRNNALHCGIHVVGGKVMVVAGSSVATVHFSNGGVRNPPGDELHPFSDTALASRPIITANNQGSLLLFTKNGFKLLGAQVQGKMADTSAGSRGSNVQRHLRAILDARGSNARKGQSPYSPEGETALEISDSLLVQQKANPANAVRGNLNVEESNTMTFVTDNLQQRVQAHEVLIEEIFNSKPVCEAIGENACATLLSDHQKIKGLLSLRYLQNEERTTLNIERRQDILKNVIRKSGEYLQNNAQQQQVGGVDMTISELCYRQPSNLLGLLRSVNEELQIVGESPASLSEKVSTAVAVAEIWNAVLTKISDVKFNCPIFHSLMPQKQLADSGKEASSQFLWLAQNDFQEALLRSVWMFSDVLAMIVGSPNANSGANLNDTATNASALNTTSAATAFTAQAQSLAKMNGEDFETILSALQNGLNLAIVHNLESAQQADFWINKWMLRTPFFSNQLNGYPHGCPLPNQDSNRQAQCQLIINAAESLAVRNNVFSTLFDFCLADISTEDPNTGAQVPSAAQLSKIEQYLAENGSFFSFMLDRLCFQGRELELKSIPEILDARASSRSAAHAVVSLVQQRNDFLSKFYPELHFLMMGDDDWENGGSLNFPFGSTLKDAVDPNTHNGDREIYHGRDSVEHCLHTTALATLAWVAADRPQNVEPMIGNVRQRAECQRDFLPEITDKVLDTEKLVDTLLEKPNNESGCWVEASKIASSCNDAALQGQLLMNCLVRAAGAEREVFQNLTTDSGAGDSERNSSICNTITAQVILESRRTLLGFVKQDKDLQDYLESKRLSDVWTVIVPWASSSSVKKMTGSGQGGLVPQ